MLDRFSCFGEFEIWQIGISVDNVFRLFLSYLFRERVWRFQAQPKFGKSSSFLDLGSKILQASLNLLGREKIRIPDFKGLIPSSTSNNEITIKYFQSPFELKTCVDLIDTGILKDGTEHFLP